MGLLYGGVNGVEGGFVESDACRACAVCDLFETLARSERPVFGFEVRDFGEIGEVAGQEGRIVSKGNCGDLQVFGSDAAVCLFETLEYGRGFLVVVEYGNTAIYLALIYLTQKISD